MAPKAWDRRETESAQAAEAFTRYLAMDPATRSTRAVGKELGKSATLIERWCTRHEWLDRARAWDADVQRRALIDEQKRAVRRQQNMIARHRKVGRKALEVALHILTNRAAEIGPAHLGLLLKGAQLEAANVSGPSVKVAMSGDLVPLASDDKPGEQKDAEAPAPAPVVMPRIEIEIMGPGGVALSADAITRELASWYDRPGEVD